MPLQVQHLGDFLHKKRRKKSICFNVDLAVNLRISAFRTTESLVKIFNAELGHILMLTTITGEQKTLCHADFVHSISSRQH